MEVKAQQIQITNAFVLQHINMHLRHEKIAKILDGHLHLNNTNYHFTGNFKETL